MKEKPGLVCAPHVETSMGMILPRDYTLKIAAAVREVIGLRRCVHMQSFIGLSLHMPQVYLLSFAHHTIACMLRFVLFKTAALYTCRSEVCSA